MLRPDHRYFDRRRDRPRSGSWQERRVDQADVHRSWRGDLPSGEPPTSRWGKWKAIRSQWRGPKYDGTILRAKIEAVVGPTTRLGEARTRLLIPSVNMTKGSVQMFKTAHHPNFLNDHKLLAADVAMATAAAPLYFPMAKIENSNFIDGGVVANAPDMCAVHEAVHFLGQRIEDIRVLSVGTTTSKFSPPSRSAETSGRGCGSRTAGSSPENLVVATATRRLHAQTSAWRSLRQVRRATVP